MGVLVIGGDRISAIKRTLQSYGVQKITHWDARNKRGVCLKSIPEGIDYIFMLTDFLNHNAMYKFKKEAKQKDIPVLCTKRSCSVLECQLCKIFGKKACEK